MSSPNQAPGLLLNPLCHRCQTICLYRPKPRTPCRQHPMLCPLHNPWAINLASNRPVPNVSVQHQSTTSPHSATSCHEHHGHPNSRQPSTRRSTSPHWYQAQAPKVIENPISTQSTLLISELRDGSVIMKMAPSAPSSPVNPSTSTSCRTRA